MIQEKGIQAEAILFTCQSLMKTRTNLLVILEQKRLTMNEKNKFNYIKIKKFCSSKGIIKRMKKNK